MSDVNPASRTAAKPKGLGRGLGSLLGATDEGAFGRGVENGKAALEKLVPSPQPVAPAKPVSPQASAAQPKPQAPVAAAAQPHATQRRSVPATPVSPVNQATPSAQGASAPVPPEVEIRAPRVEMPTTPSHLRVWQIAIEKIEPNPNQPRQTFAKEALEELAQSIREKGVIQPILVRKQGLDKFEIIAGERRWRAAQLAGLKDLPALLKDTNDQEVLELALIENIQRQDLNVVEEAEAYDYLIKKYNLTQQELAQKVGKDRATIANLLRLLNLQPSIRTMVSKGQLSLGQAKVLLSISDEKMQETLAHRAINESLSVRMLEKLAAKANQLEIEEITQQDDLRHRLAKTLQDELQKLIGSKVSLDYMNGKGKISIQFYSDQELNQIAEKLRKSWLQR
jgi:ParB family chromosome partitioning protein